jgi:ADP-ribose pyrophosphatase
MPGATNDAMTTRIPEPGVAADLKEHMLEERVAYTGKFIRLRHDTVRLPDGNTAFREFITHPGAVAVLPLLDNGQLLLERQHRYPLGRDFIEIPAGKLDEGETIQRCAERELLEETGYRAARWTHLGTAHPCIGYADERIEYFLAEGLAYEGRQLDEGEFLDVFAVPLADASAMAHTGHTTDSKSIVGLFWLEKHLAGRGG